MYVVENLEILLEMSKLCSSFSLLGSRSAYLNIGQPCIRWNPTFNIIFTLLKFDVEVELRGDLFCIYVYVTRLKTDKHNIPLAVMTLYDYIFRYVSSSANKRKKYMLIGIVLYL
jgi:hypothetical protein